MSRRGGKRRPVLQLGNSSSKLHRYGYSKEFHSKDKKVSTLVGAYSDSEESDNESDNEQQTVGEPPELENGETADGMTAALPTERGDEGSQNPEAHMDDELKTFLSEIEAIPMPVDMMAASVEQAGETEIHDFPEETRIKEEEPQNNTTTKSKHSYSMFVKGEPEFVNNTKMDATNDKGEQKETETKDLLSEIPIEPTTNWQMVQDETTQYYYYWNIVTNEVTWEIPTEYTQFLLLHKEYEEKLAKFTPEQLQAIKDRAQRLLAKENVSKETTTVTASMHDVVTQNDTSLSALSVYGKDDTRELSKRDMVTERLSPRPDSTSDSHHRKHKKEKRSHHKKKHKRKHSDSDSEGSSKRSPKMPDLGAAVLAETVEKTSSAGQKLASIVPYLSDQDDDDNEEETSMPELGPQDLPDSNTSSPPTREGGPEKDTIMPEIGPAIKPAETVLSQDVSAAQSEEAVEIDPSILLLPPPPPPPAEEEKDKYDVDTKRISQRDIESEKGEEINRAVKTQIFSGLLETEMLSSNSDPSSVNEILNAIAHTPLDVVDKGMKAEEMEGKLVPNTTQDLSKLDKGEQKHRHHEIPKVDMFAEDYPPLNSTAQATDYPMDKGEDSSIQDGIDVTEEKIENSGKEKMIVSSEKPKVVEESMEEGELSEASEKDNTISKTLQTGEKELSVAVTKNKSGSVLNIVGYGSDEEEEEGEVKDYEMKEEDKHEKKKKKSKKKDWKKSKKDSKADYSFMDGKLDKEILSKMSDTIDQTISKIVTQTVDQAVSGLAAEKPKGTTQQEDGDIDFEDLDDIDRALEVALEKKLEKKKAALAQVTEREKSNEDVVVTDQAPAVLVSGGDEKAVGVTEDSPAYTSKKSKHDERTTVSMENDEENLKAEIKEMADLALSKLEFLDISTESLSRLQILFIELQTRQTDWVAGGLSSQYFYEQLKVAESLLKQYELSAVPEGWACQWDSVMNFMMMNISNTNINVQLSLCLT